MFKTIIIFHVKTPKTFDKIIKYTQRQKSRKFDLLSMQIKNLYLKTHTHVITIQKSCQCQKRIKQTVCATSLFTHYFFDTTKCKHAEVKLYEKLNND